MAFVLPVNFWAGKRVLRQCRRPPLEVPAQNPPESRYPPPPPPTVRTRPGLAHVVLVERGLDKRKEEKEEPKIGLVVVRRPAGVGGSGRDLAVFSLPLCMRA